MVGHDVLLARHSLGRYPPTLAPNLCGVTVASVPVGTEPDEVAAPDPECLGGVGRVATDHGQPATRVDDQSPVALREIGVGGDTLDHRGGRVSLDGDALRLIEPGGGEVRAAYVELHVAEAVEVEHLAGDLPGLHLGFRNQDFCQRLRLNRI